MGFLVDELLLVVTNRKEQDLLKQFRDTTSQEDEPFARFPDGRTLLHFAAGYGKVQVVEPLVRRGADVNAQTIKGIAPLHDSSEHCHYKSSKVLLKAGAKVDIRDEHGWTPLHFVLARKDNSPNISPRNMKLVHLLLQFGADPSIKSVRGKSCFARVKDLETRCGMKLKYIFDKLKGLKELGPISEDDKDILISSCIGKDDFFELVKLGDEQIETLEQITTNTLLRSRLKNFGCIMPLHRAAGYNHLATSKLFINLGAEVNAEDQFGRIPLHNAAQYGHVSMIELLVSEGADINKQDQDGYSPLHVSAFNKTFTACLKLLELGANANLLCKEGKFPYDLAQSDDVREVLRPDTLRHRIAHVSSSSTNAIYMSDLQITHYNLDGRERTDPDGLMLDSDSFEFKFSREQYTIKREPIPETDRRYQLIKKRMLETIMLHDDESCGKYTSYDIVSIEGLQHKKVWSKYKLMCQKLEIDYGVGSRNERLLFHGSNFIDKIQNQGFDERYAQRNGMFGAGIYFAEHSSKSNQYTFGWGQGCEKHKNKTCFLCERKMIYAQVALGRSLISKEAMPDCAHAPPGYSSVTGTPEATVDLKYPEYVIYCGDQAYPLFVITYRIKFENHQ